jgi:hypothetical protein
MTSLFVEKPFKNINASNKNGAQSDCYIKINSSNPQNIIIGTTDIISIRQNTFYSLDGGNSFSPSSINPAFDPRKDFVAGYQSDPCVVFLNNGTAFYINVNTDKKMTIFTIGISKSIDEGKTWLPDKFFQENIFNGIYERPFMCVGKIQTNSRLGLLADRLHICWNLTGESNSVLYLYQDTLRNTYSELKSLNINNNQIAGAIPFADDNGTVYVAWHDIDDKAIYISYSTDGGVTFFTPPSFVCTTFLKLDVMIPPQMIKKALIYPVGGIDPINGDVYISLIDAVEKNSSITELYYLTSPAPADNKLTFNWSEKKTVSTFDINFNEDEPKFTIKTGLTAVNVVPQAVAERIAAIVNSIIPPSPSNPINTQNSPEIPSNVSVSQIKRNANSTQLNSTQLNSTQLKLIKDVTHKLTKYNNILSPSYYTSYIKNNYNKQKPPIISRTKQTIESHLKSKEKQIASLYINPKNKAHEYAGLRSYSQVNTTFNDNSLIILKEKRRLRYTRTFLKVQKKGFLDKIKISNEINLANQANSTVRPLPNPLKPTLLYKFNHWMIIDKIPDESKTYVHFAWYDNREDQILYTDTNVYHNRLIVTHNPNNSVKSVLFNKIDSKVTDVSSNATVENANLNQYGDHIGLDVHNNVVIPCWVDTRNIDSQLKEDIFIGLQ